MNKPLDYQMKKIDIKWYGIMTLTCKKAIPKKNEDFSSVIRVIAS